MRPEEDLMTGGHVRQGTCLLAAAILGLAGCSHNPQTGSIQGEFQAEGPAVLPLSGLIEVHIGTLVVSGNGSPVFGRVLKTVSIPADGRFAIKVPAPGTYTLSGRSPKDADGLCWSGPVQVRPDVTATVNVDGGDCQIQ
ncbi:MAG: hypothetical protein ACRDJU_09295 [Actinomycetota bacterium]